MNKEKGILLSLIINLIFYLIMSYLSVDISDHESIPERDESKYCRNCLIFIGIFCLMVLSLIMTTSSNGTVHQIGRLIEVLFIWSGGCFLFVVCLVILFGRE